MSHASVYLDNAATTFPKPDIVYSEVDLAFRTVGGNAMRGSSPFARQASALVNETRVAVANLFGVSDAQRVVFSPSATLALNQVILGAVLPPAPNVYVTPFEHNSVLRPIEHMRRTCGWQVNILPFDPVTLTLKRESAQTQFAQAPPDLVVCTQASNVFGAMPDIEGLATSARHFNPRVVVVVDGAQAAGVYPLSVESGLVDYLVFSGHKSLHGPYGVAGFVCATDNRTRPIFFGGTGTHSELLDPPLEGPGSFEVGSINLPAIAGLRASLEWLSPERRRDLRNKGAELLVRLENGLSAIPEVTVFAPKGPRVPVLSFTLSHMSPQEADLVLGARGFSVRTGLQCSPLAHRLVGTLSSGGTIRVSPGFFTTEADIDQFLDAVESICCA